MHYRNGRAAHEGDPVIAETWKGSGKFVAGTLHSTMPNATTCNGQLAVASVGGSVQHHVTIGECFHAEDAFAAAVAKLTEAPQAAEPAAQAAS